MSIITRCPGCGTTFRVTPPQLQAQHGMVRCGRCAHVFDGFKTLATLPETTTAEVAPDAMAGRDAPVEEATPAPPAEIFFTPEPDAPAAPESGAPTTLEPDLPIELPVAATASAPPPFTHPAVATPEPLSFAPPAPARNGGWVFGALLLLALLAGQGAYLYRSDIAASVPEARPALGKMCELLSCTVALPQRPRQISIEASDMQATDPARPGLIALTATLRNQATIELGYPALDVVLTNSKDHTVARRIFLPAEYLVAGKDPRAGIAPNAEVTVRLDVETGDLGAAGFRLDLMAAPAR